jgi:hypothetical protein
MRSARVPAPLTDPTVDLLQQILATLLRLEAAQTRRSSTSTLTRRDRRLLIVLLPPVAGLGSEWHTARELLEEPAVQAVAGDLTARELGRVLRRATGVPIDGLVVEAGDTEMHRMLWRVLATV